MSVDVSKIRPGDTVTAEYDGHTFSGPVWESGNGALYLGTQVIRWAGGAPKEHITITAHTPAPRPLPTTPGSTVTTRGGVVFMRTGSLGRCWVSSVSLLDGSDLRWMNDDEVLALDLDRSLDHDRGAPAAAPEPEDQAEDGPDLLDRMAASYRRGDDKRDAMAAALAVVRKEIAGLPLWATAETERRYILAALTPTGGGTDE